MNNYMAKQRIETYIYIMKTVLILFISLYFKCFLQKHVLDFIMSLLWSIVINPRLYSPTILLATARVQLC